MPDTVTTVTAVAGVASATVTWQVPPGLVATGFRVTPYTGGVAGAPRDVGPVALAVVDGLTPGQPYTFTVRALAGTIPGPESAPSNAVTPLAAGAAGAVPPPAPTSVTLTPRQRSIDVAWTAPASGGPFVASELLVYADGHALAPQLVLGAGTATTLAAVFGGVDYAVEVRTRNGIGWSPLSARSAEARIDFTPLLPDLSTDALLVPDGGPELDRRLLAAAAQAASKWRYEVLREQALAAASEVASFEGEIGRLMQMALDKSLGAEELLSPVLLSVTKDILDRLDAVAGLATAPSLDAALDEMAKALSDVTLLQRILAFFAEFSPVAFWRGLFDALIGDIAATDGALPGTEAFLRDQFDSGDIGAAIKAHVDDLLANLDREVDALVAPLAGAIASMVAGTSDAMGEVFASFDLPLLQRGTGAPGVTVPNVTPFDALGDKLKAAVQALAERIKAALRDVLTKFRAESGFFWWLMRTYAVLPLLAFLLVAITSGPIGAAALGAIVLVGVQELVRLLAGWLTGPLQGQLDRVKERLRDATALVQAAVLREAEVVARSAPDVKLRMLADQLRQVRTLLPEAFLDEAAQVLMEARDVLLGGAIQVARGAEQALGLENATAFDTVPYGYGALPTPAPQLPGGNDPSRLAGARLIRDLGRLDRQRTAVADGKDLEVTERLSLADLLGGPAAFAEFLQRGEVVVDLTGDRLDRRFPGLYRALVKEVSVEGVVTDLPEGLTGPGFPVAVTHLGESATRIKRGANPAAPPLELPRCLGTADEFVEAALGEDVLRAWYREAVEAWQDAHGGAGVSLDTRYEIARSYLPGAIAEAARAATCDLVDGAPLAAAAERVLGGVPHLLPSWYHLSPLSGSDADFSATDANTVPQVVARGRFSSKNAPDELLVTANGNQAWVLRYDAAARSWRSSGPSPIGTGKVARFAVGDFFGDGRSAVVAAPAGVADTAAGDLWVSRYDVAAKAFKPANPLAGNALGASIDLTALAAEAAAPMFGANAASAASGQVAALVAGDFDGDGRDEVAVILARFDRSGDDVWVLDFDTAAKRWFVLGGMPLDLSWFTDRSGPVPPDLRAWPEDPQPWRWLDGVVLPKLAVAADLDGNGRAELVIVHADRYGSDALNVYAFDPATSRWSSDEPQPTVQVRWLVTGDYDGDGRPELAVASTSQSGTGNDFWVYDFDPATNTRWRLLSRNPSYRSFDITAPYPASIAVSGDFDGDGRDELAVALARAGTEGNDFYVVRWDGTTWVELGAPSIGGWAHIAAYQVDLSTGGFAARAAVTADVNGDGRDELVALPLVTQKDRDEYAALRFALMLFGTDIGPDSRADNGWVMAYRSATDLVETVEQVIVDAVRQGTGGTGGVLDVARRAHAAVVAELTDHIAKWGEAEIREDPDHDVGALGFASLVRRAAPETAVFNLVPEGATAASVRAVPLLGTPDGFPSGVPSTRQYRPFENRGFAGRLLVSLPGLPEDAADVVPLGLGGLLPGGVGVGAARLTDLVLSVTLRGCHDNDLAATVRASRSRRRSDEAAVSRAASRAVTFVSNVPGTGPSEQRTVHLSLRAHRDRVLRTWLAALSAGARVRSSGAQPKLTGIEPLGVGVPFAPLVKGLKRVEVRLATTPPPLSALESVLALTPADLGVVAGGRLREVGIAVIPDGRFEKAVRLTVGAEGEPLLPGFATPTALDRHLYATAKPAAVDLDTLWDATAALLAFDVYDAVRGKRLYDLIVSLTFTTALPEVAAL